MYVGEHVYAHACTHTENKHKIFALGKMSVIPAQHENYFNLLP